MVSYFQSYDFNITSINYLPIFLNDGIMKTKQMCPSTDFSESNTLLLFYYKYR